MTWVDLSSAFGFGTKLTSAQMQNLRDNVVSAVQSLAYLADGAEHADSSVGWTTVLLFPFVCPERNTDVHLYAAIKAQGGGGTTRVRIMINSVASASYGEGTDSGNYVNKDCGTLDISGLTPLTMYDGEIQMINLSGSGDGYVKGIVLTID